MNILKLNDGPKPAEDASGPKLTPEELEEKIIDALRTVYDPEIPVNIYELGLVYGIKIDPKGNVVVRMTLTSPGCPVAGSLPPEVESKVLSVPGVTSARVDLVWNPQWNLDMMSEAAKLQLGFY
jgi:FeS assembly SUF system protein